jgi:hypothetical protein
MRRKSAKFLSGGTLYTVRKQQHGQATHPEYLLHGQDQQDGQAG